MKIKGIKKGFFYYLPTKVFFGRGVLKLLTELPEVKEAKKVLLFTGSSSLAKSGIKSKVIESLKRRKKTVVVYSEIKSSIDNLNKAIKATREFKPEVIVAIGGGTVLDTAKISACLATNSGKIEDFVVTKSRVLSKPPLSLVALPTTAGTGSEVSPFAVAWGSKEAKKYSFYSNYLYPTVTLIDPELFLSLPPYQTACTGMDALGQAIEAYWANNHNPISDLLALEAIHLILANLKKAVKRGKSIDFREKMARAALMSGLAFSNTKTTICHAISYPITAHWGVHHGQAATITLPSFIEYNFSILEKGRQEAILRALRSSDKKESAKKITVLMKEIGLKTRLSQLGIEKKDLNLIVREGFSPERVSNAPRIPTKKELKEILVKIF